MIFQDSREVIENLIFDELKGKARVAYVMVAIEFEDLEQEKGQE